MKTLRNHTVFMLLAIIFGKQAMAQEKADSLPSMKNEIGINLIPFAFMLNNGSDNSGIPLLHLFYKRQLKTNLYGRLAVSLNNGLQNNNYATASLIKTTSNTSASIEYNYYKAKNYGQYYAGLEGRWGRKNIRQFAGFDLSYANYKTETETVSQPIIGTSWNDSTIAHYKHTSNTIGLHPFYGLIFDFSKHFFISAQVGLNLQFTSRNSEKIIDNRNLPFYTNGNVTNFDLNTFGVSNNISVCYRF